MVIRISSLTSPEGIVSLIGVFWLIWLVYWWSQAFSVKRAQWRESWWDAAAHRVPIVLAVLVMANPNVLPHVFRGRWLPAGIVAPVVGLAMAVAGLGFTVWARLHLGRNWSGAVTVKAGHTLIRTGPYRVVRHPIYTGLLVAFAGTVVANGEWRALVAMGLAVVAILRKSRSEERRMSATFPEYASYRQTTAALIPFLY